jgi:hypothetical protein
MWSLAAAVLFFAYYGTLIAEMTREVKQRVSNTWQELLESDYKVTMLYTLESKDIFITLLKV